MKNYSILTIMVPLPTQAEMQPGQPIPVAVSLPNNAIPLQVEYRPAMTNVPASCAVHYLTPCDEKGNPIEEEVIIPSVYKTAWNELYKCFGERMEQDNLDAMDAVLKGVMLDIESEQEARAETEK